MPSRKPKQPAKSKTRKPTFVRQESWRYVRVKDPWRRPQGITSRMRRRRIGWPKSPLIGYKKSESLRHRHPCDLIEAIVHNPKQVEQLDPTKHVVRISHSVGERKRVMIIDSAKARNLKVLNPRITRTTEPLEQESDDLGLPESDKDSVPPNKKESEEGF